MSTTPLGEKRVGRLYKHEKEYPQLCTETRTHERGRGDNSTAHNNGRIGTASDGILLFLLRRDRFFVRDDTARGSFMNLIRWFPAGFTSSGMGCEGEAMGWGRGGGRAVKRVVV